MQYGKVLFCLSILLSPACGTKKETKDTTEAGPAPLSPRDIVVNVPPQQQAPIQQDPPKGGGDDGGCVPSPGNPCTPPDDGGGPVPCNPGNGGPIIVGNGAPCVPTPYPGFPGYGNGGPIVNPCAPLGTVGNPVYSIPCAPGFPRGPRFPRGGIPRGPLGTIDQDCYKTDLFGCQIENYVAGEINGFRQARGLPLLAPSFQIAFSARQWSQTQAVSLAPLLPADLQQRMNVMVIEFGPGNIAFGVPPNGALVSQTVAITTLVPGDDIPSIGNAILQVIVNNPTSFSVITDPTLRAFGVGIAIRGNQVYITQLFSN